LLIYCSVRVTRLVLYSVTRRLLRLFTSPCRRAARSQTRYTTPSRDKQLDPYTRARHARRRIDAVCSKLYSRLSNYKYYKRISATLHHRMKYVSLERLKLTFPQIADRFSYTNRGRQSNVLPVDIGKRVCRVCIRLALGNRKPVVVAY